MALTYEIIFFDSLAVDFLFYMSFLRGYGKLMAADLWGIRELSCNVTLLTAIS